MPIETKITNQLLTVRLCSPNYSGVYEFNPAKNGNTGSNNITFNVDVTLKPFQPYIHINPVFGGIYGSDFNDCRGLICGGDFSLGIVSDPWISYQFNNKNYQKTFDREIESLDLRQDIQKFESTVGAVMGTVGAAASGAVTGSKAGPYGAVAGAVVGGATGAVTGAIDLANLGLLQKDQRDLAIDKYKMSLENVRALPMSINKVDALTYNNKLVPFIEVYTCTEEEKKAFIDKIVYEGMTIGIIDTIANWTEHDYTSYRFLKAQLIRCADILEDTHMINEINVELEKGVYF